MSTLSTRGQALLSPQSLYSSLSAKAWNNRHHPKTNPSGYVDLSVAENGLSIGQVTKFLSTAPPCPATALDYGSPHAFRETLSTLLSTHLTHTPVSAHQIIQVNGAKAAIEVLATVLCDNGDAVLTTGPGYYGIKKFVEARIGARLIVAPLDDHLPDGHPVMSVTALERAWQAARGVTSRIRVAVICSPNNPTGEVFSVDLVKDIVQWGRRRKVHLVFDEIYALSVHAENVKFVSVAEVMDGVLGDFVHMVWSISKDFCIPGTRLGLLYSQNEDLLGSAGGVLSTLSGTSRHTEWAVGHMLTDERWLQGFFASNRIKLRAAYNHMVDILHRMDIPYMPAQAGFFVWVDLRRWMDGDTADDEMVLWRKMCDAQVVLLPSSQSLGTRFGFFRICFAAVDHDTLDMAWERLKEEVIITA